MKSTTTVSVAVAAAMLASSAVTFAQEEGVLEEIIVTATKREQTLQDVPVAVTVTSVETINKASIQDVTDLASIVPSLRVTTLQTSTQTNFLIRGFGNGANNPGIEPSVGVFIDGVYRSRSAGAISDLVDIERVEVLRGPQSTLFGQNASAGVISVVTKKPEFQFGTMIEGTIGNYNQKILKARVTGPLGDNVAFSLASILHERDGYFTDLASGSKMNDRDRADVRAQLLWNVSDTLEVRVIGDYGSINEVCCGVVNLVDGPTGNAIRALGGQIYADDPFDRNNYVNKLPLNYVENSGASLHLTWDLDNWGVSSITSLRNQKTKFDYDFDFTSGDLGAVNLNEGDIDTMTQEIRLEYDAGGSVRGLLGAYYITEEVQYDNTIRIGNAFRNYASLLAGGITVIPGLEASLRPFGVPTGSLFRANTGNLIETQQDSDAYTLFGQVDFDLTDRLTLTAGLAYTNTQKDVVFEQTTDEAFSSLNFVNIGFGLINAQLAPLAALGVPAATLAAIADQASVADGQLVPCFNPPPPIGAFTGAICNPLLALYPLQFLHPVVPFSDSSDDSKTTYTVRLAYDLNDNVNVYGGVSTGYKATSWNLSRDSKPFAPATAARSPLGGALNPWYPRYGTRYAGPEESTVYEVGLKARTDRFAINVAIFDQEIEGFQSNLFLGTGFVLGNAGKQSTTGIEIETQFRAGANWQFDIAGTFLNPKYDSFVGAQGPNGPTDLSGTKPAGIHEQSISTGVTYNWSVDGIDGFVRADHLYESNVQVTENISTAIANRSVSTINASIGMNISDWEVLVWGRNLSNDNYLLSAFPSVAQTGSFSGYTNQPRTYGITLRKSF